MHKNQIIRAMILSLFAAGLCLAQSLVPLDPASISDGHVYLLEDETDSSSNANTGNIIGAPQVVDGLTGLAMQFNGVDDGIHLPDAATINTSTHTNKTVIAVFNCADVSKSEKQIVYEEGGTTRGLNIYVHEGLAYAGGWNPADYTPQWPGTFISAPIGSNEWHVVVAVVRDGGPGMEDDKFEMWMDGQLIGKGPGAQLNGRSDDIGIGHGVAQTKAHDGNITAGGSWFEGIIDEVWILNTPLTEAELASLGPNQANAKDPVPDDAVTDVLRNSALTWTPGKYAVSHNLYFGDSFDDVNTATTPLAALDVNSFEPGRLDFGKTYYWRVDEVNGAPDRTVFKGDVWSFTAEPYSIAIPGSEIIVTASSQSNDMSTPDKAIDGSGLGAGNTHSMDNTDMWFSASVDLDPWIQFEFEGVYKMDAMKVWNSNGAAEPTIGWGVKDLEIQVSVDGETWDILPGPHQLSRAPGLPTYNQFDTVPLNGVAAKHVRFNIQSNWGGLLMAYGLSEVQFMRVPAQARTPEPASDSVDVLPDATLAWRAGREAAAHVVYISTDVNAVIDRSVASVTTSTNSLSLDDIGGELGQTYYWAVDEVNEAEAISVWPGPVWTVNTSAALVVDDFEGYSNASPDRPFQTWLDGFGYSADDFFTVGYGGNGTGAGIGHDIWGLASPYFDGDIMETMITMQGSSQSMPFYYDNSGTGTSSETTANIADLQVGQDWSKSGIGTLTLHFRAESLSEALDTTYDITTEGDALWFSQDVNSYEDGDAARSGALGNNVQSSMQTTVTGPGTVSFYWKVSSEVDWDFLDFYIDGAMQDQISGEVDWEQKTYQITGAGAHTLEWRYTKDQAVFGGLDAGWVDKLEWDGAGQPATAPGNTGQLYAKINGTKVTYPGGVTNVKWAAWQIDLASLGVNLQNVTSLTIGVEGNNASGTLYLDNFLLEPATE